MDKGKKFVYVWMCLPDKRQTDKGREREGNIPRQLLSVVLLHARSIFVVTSDSLCFHQDFSHILLCVCVCVSLLFASYLLAVNHDAFMFSELI